MQKYYGNFQNYFQKSSSPTKECWEPMTQLDESFARCFSSLLRGERGWKHEINQIAVFAVIFVTDC